MIRLGALVMLAAAFFFGVLHLWMTNRKYVILEKPIHLAAGSVFTAQIAPQISDTYEIIVETKRTLPFQQQNCLLGLSSYGVRCDKGQSVLDVSWRLRQGETVVDQGGTDHIPELGGWSAGTIGRTVGLPKLSGGSYYSLEFRSNGDSRALEITQPVLKVAVSSMTFKGDFVMAQLGSLFLMVTGLIGAAITVLGGIGFWQRHVEGT